MSIGSCQIAYGSYARHTTAIASVLLTYGCLVVDFLFIQLANVRACCISERGVGYYCSDAS